MVERPIAVAGHCCVDMIPAFDTASGRSEAALTPGKLVHVGPAHFATGGPVSNVGLALHHLGVPPRLFGKVGDDLLGSVLLDLLRCQDPSLADGMIVAPGETTSYSVVISPPGVDRIFLHCPGVNDTFAAADLAEADLEGVRILHFGYPPLMQRIYQEDGRELVSILEQARRQEVMTSLDMALPDPASEAGQLDWTAFLQRVLPQVDLFLPSAEELLFMLDRSLFEQLQTYAAGASIVLQMDGELLALLAEECLAFGAALVGLKLGDQGLYLRTTTEQRRLETIGRGFSDDQHDWRGRELLVPCFQARVVGTTGAGDATIAGFLTSLLAGTGPETALRDAVAVGACSVEAADASSAIPTWEAVQQRAAAGWQPGAVWLSLPGWRQDTARGIWYGPHDRQESA
ncbi:MAG TPA: carbohydrate kinase family protein [Ktedonobacterales bacterium]|nr:carbohydrate kinase family protein [Ktedonobacterales bacterium]